MRKIILRLELFNHPINSFLVTSQAHETWQIGSSIAQDVAPDSLFIWCTRHNWCADLQQRLWIALQRFSKMVRRHLLHARGQSMCLMWTVISLDWAIIKNDEDTRPELIHLCRVILMFHVNDLRFLATLLKVNSVNKNLPAWRNIYWFTGLTYLYLLILLLQFNLK